MDSHIPHNRPQNRRAFLSTLGAAAIAAPAPTAAAAPAHATPQHTQWIDILRPPDSVWLHTPSADLPLPAAGGLWRLDDVQVAIDAQPSGRATHMAVSVAAKQTGLGHICLRWSGAFPAECRFLGDHWERSYGDLEWRDMVPNRIMPWYFVAFDGHSAHAYGVETGPAAFCFWQADPDGISLWLDLRNGGGPVRLGERELKAAVLTSVHGAPGESPLSVTRRLCRALCPRPRLAAAPIYGGNNWYYTYGRNFTAADVLRDSAMLADLAGAEEKNRPFMVIDMGWSPAPDGAGPLIHGNAAFPDMPGLAARMKQRGARPGIWLRPLLTTEVLPRAWRIPANRLSGETKPPSMVLDPSVPDALEHVRRSVAGVAAWGFELIKHDFSTFDMFGRWGFQMGAVFTNSGWHWADRGKTNAEVVTAFYRALRAAAGNALLLGCNTVGHLGAGLFEAQRIGDDTSGRQWERTRKMGVNTLAFRLAQNQSFFAADPDCVPVTPEVPWKMTRQWLDLVARSGAPLFVSVDPASFGAEQKRALQQAFAVAARPQPEAAPLDWLNTTAPEKWQLGGAESTYDWYEGTGASPFTG